MSNEGVQGAGALADQADDEAAAEAFVERLINCLNRAVAERVADGLTDDELLTEMSRGAHSIATDVLYVPADNKPLLRKVHSALLQLTGLAILKARGIITATEAAP